MMRGLAVAVALSAGLAGACSPKGPAGVDKNVLDQAVSEAIGDPGTCVLIADQGKVVYQYGTHMICGRELPACDGPGTRTVADLVKGAPVQGDPKTASCRSNPEGTRIVAWASGPIEGAGLVYAAVMDGERTPPGIVAADKLKTAFKEAGLGAK